MKSRYTSKRPAVFLGALLTITILAVFAPGASGGDQSNADTIFNVKVDGTPVDPGTPYTFGDAQRGTQATVTVTVENNIDSTQPAGAGATNGDIDEFRFFLDGSNDGRWLLSADDQNGWRATPVGNPPNEILFDLGSIAPGTSQTFEIELGPAGGTVPSDFNGDTWSVNTPPGSGANALGADPGDATVSNYQFALAPGTIGEGRIIDVSDPFVQVGTGVAFIVEVRDVSGNVWADAPTLSGTWFKVFQSDDAVQDNGDDVQITQSATDANGRARITLSEATANDPYFYIEPFRRGLKTIPHNDGPLTQVVWTELEHASAPVIIGPDQVGRNDTVTTEVDLRWAHDGSPAVDLAEGSLSNGMAWDLVGDGERNGDPLVASPKSDLTIAAFDTVDGKYRIEYAHHRGGDPLIESVDFTLTGEIVGYTNATMAETQDQDSSFTIPSAVPLHADWIGAVAGAITMGNVEDPLDSTPGFVNLNETVRVTVPVNYTGNYQSGGPVLGAKVSFFRTANGTGEIEPEDNNDAFLHCADGDAACDVDGFEDGTVTVAIPLSLVNGTETADVYEITALVTEFTAGGDTILQEIVPDDLENDRLDMGSVITITWTGVEVALQPGSVAGVADVDEARGRWWMTADKDAGGNTDDVITFRVTANFTFEDGLRVPADATIGAYRADGSAFQNLSGVNLTSETDDSGVASFAIDPDHYGIDYDPTDLVFRIMSAPEHAGAPGTATIEYYDVVEDVFEQQVLWTKVHVHLDLVDSGDFLEPDNELDLGGTVRIRGHAFYYHDEFGFGGDTYRDVMNASMVSTQDLQLMPGQIILDVDESITLEFKDHPARQGLEVSHPDRQGEDGVARGFVEVWRGCAQVYHDDVDNTGCDADVQYGQAGWHNFGAAASDIPHNIGTDYEVDGFESVQVDRVDVLWTAIVLDAATDELAMEAQEDITASVEAYYAHNHTADGDPLSLASREVAGFDVNLDIVDVGSDDLWMQTSSSPITPATPAEFKVRKNATGAATIRFETPATGQKTTDASTYPVTTVYPSQELTRLWANVTIAGGYNEAAADIDYNGDGNKDDVLYVHDNVTLRNEVVEIRAVLAMDAGEDATGGETVIGDGYGGLEFTTDDTPAPGVDNMPVRMLELVPEPIGVQDMLETLGDELLNMNTDLDREPGQVNYTYDSGYWKADIPVHSVLEEGILFDHTVALNVTKGHTVDTDEAGPVPHGNNLTLNAEDEDAVRMTYTAILYRFENNVNADDFGETAKAAGQPIWVNYNSTSDLTVRALWAHDTDGDGSSYILSGTIDGGDVVLGATFEEFVSDPAYTPTILEDAAAPGNYTATLDTSSVADSVLYKLHVASVADPSTGDATQVFTNVSNPLLSLEVGGEAPYYEQLANHTYFDLTYSSDTGRKVANVNSEIDQTVAVRWAHTDAPLEESEFPLWDIAGGWSPIGRGDAPSFVNTLSIPGTSAITLDLGGADAPRLVTEFVELPPHNITAYQVPGDGPLLKWDHIVTIGMGDDTSTAAAGTSTSSDCGRGGSFSYTNPQGDTDCDVYEGGTLVTQPAQFVWSNGSAIPQGSTVSINGRSINTPDATGEAWTRVRSDVDFWALPEGRGINAEHEWGATTITAFLPARNYVGFDGTPADGMIPT